MSVKYDSAFEGETGLQMRFAASTTSSAVMARAPLGASNSTPSCSSIV